MRVVFIHRGGEGMASYRYRTAIPAKHMGASINNGFADVVVFSKPSEADIAIAVSAKKDGAKIVVDFCDDHFERAHYLELAKLSDVITCSSSGMRDVIKEHGFDSEIIEDPYEFDISEPHANGKSLAWFGHPSNLNEVLPCLPLCGDITIVTGKNSLLENYIEWSVASLSETLKNTNIVLIPDGKRTRSNNRMVNAIASGCFVVGGSQLEPWKKFVFAGKIHHGLQYSRCFKDELNSLVLEGQEYIRQHNAPEVIAKKWSDICESI